MHSVLEKDPSLETLPRIYVSISYAELRTILCGNNSTRLIFLNGVDFRITLSSRNGTSEELARCWENLWTRHRMGQGDSRGRATARILEDYNVRYVIEI